MITCENCKKTFELNETAKASMVLSDGQFFGYCPHCGWCSWPIPEPGQFKHSDASVLSFVEMMELAGDNFCQRCVDLLWERNWRAQFMGVMQ